jgi:DNA-directed RNA polymerase specialized sigma24 family protein
MISRSDLESLDENAEFHECRKAVNRFIRSQIFSSEDADDLTQLTVMRVIEHLQQERKEEVNEGYFMEVAKLVRLEYFRKIKNDQKRYQSGYDNEEETGAELPIDAPLQLSFYEEAQDRALINACLLECFENLSQATQELLWRYSFEEKKHRMDGEEPSAYTNFFGPLLESLREIRDKFIRIQDGHTPITENVRVKICRIRKNLRECLTNCVTRKKGL